MLVLGRKITEGIVLTGGIRITILEAGRGRVRIGIEAPQDVKVWRSEHFPTDGTPPSDPRPNPKKAVTGV